MSDRERINANEHIARQNCEDLRRLRLRHCNAIGEGTELEHALDILQERLDRAARELGREVGGPRGASPQAPARETSSEESVQGSSPDDEPPDAA